MKETQRLARNALRKLHRIRDEVYARGTRLAKRWSPSVEKSAFQKSALNLAFYLALRRYDLRPIQQMLIPLGISSLGRCEAHVLPSLDAVLATLGAIVDGGAVELPPRPSTRLFAAAAEKNAQNSVALLGPQPRERVVHIMVTLPTEAASRPTLVRSLISAGADCVRINCAHDNRQLWLRMVKNVRAASAALGKTCRVLMDLTGPRARTTDAIPADHKDRIRRGERILLTGGTPSKGSKVRFQARCSLPEILPELQPKRLIYFNEGRIGAEVERQLPEGALLRVVSARERGEKFRSDMALNFPGTNLHIPPLTEKDLLDLDFIVEHADLVGYSFVQRPEDISMLLGELDARRSRMARKPKLGIIAKIETEFAVRNLPEIIVRAAGRGPFGVMIARGDLAVEVGYRRVGELQEEILWLCEAAHIPVIWATQVLETLAKKGTPTRAEITDAAMGERAECVMLNKGPYILEAVHTLNQVLARMGGHHHKKTAAMRPLKTWSHLIESC